MTDILIMKNIEKSFTQGDKKLDILQGVNLTLSSGTVTALVGKSGAGKSTLLQIAGLLDDADSGTISIGGDVTEGLGKEQRAALRGRHLGFVYQFHHLMPDFSAQENVSMPLLIQGISKREALDRSRDMLSRMGLEDRLEHRPSQLSGGEKQRVAIARGLVHGPKLLLADEPTGNLDENTSERVLDALLDIVEKTGVAALIATHDRRMAKKLTRTIELSQGQLHNL